MSEIIPAFIAYEWNCFPIGRAPADAQALKRLATVTQSGFRQSRCIFLNNAKALSLYPCCARPEMSELYETLSLCNIVLKTWSADIKFPKREYNVTRALQTYVSEENPCF